MAIELLTPFTKVELEVEKKETNRKQVGILGGNFNPVHNAHLIVADQVRQQLKLDQVLLMPEFIPPHVDKKKPLTNTIAIPCSRWLLQVWRAWGLKPLNWNAEVSAIPTTP